MCHDRGVRTIPAAQLSLLRRLRLAKDAMDRDWAEPLDLDAVAARPYGTEAIFRDDSGNWFSFTQRRDQLDLDEDWACRYSNTQTTFGQLSRSRPCGASQSPLYGSTAIRHGPSLKKVCRPRLKPANAANSVVSRKAGRW